MIEFVPTADMAVVRSLLTDERVYHRSANDSAPPIESYSPVLKGDIVYVLALDDGEPIAVFVLKAIPEDANAAEVHFAFHPSRWGRTKSTCGKFLAWVWRKTRFNTLIGPVPSYNHLARNLAQSVGFEPWGTRRDAGEKHGKSFDLNLMAIRRPR